MNPEKHIIK